MVIVIGKKQGGRNLAMANLPVYFIRHNFDIDPLRDRILNDLFKNREIGIHFSNHGIDPASYPESTSRSALTRLKKAAANDCIIVAAYRDKSEIILGKPGRNGVVLKNEFSDDHKEMLEIKSLQLEETFLVNVDELPLLSVLQPPYATLVQWHVAETAVNSFYAHKESGEKGTKPLGLNLLSGWHCEILCEEWLRANNLLAYKLFKTGKSMKDFDIVGKDCKGMRVLAQVKFESFQSHFDQFCRQMCVTASNGHKIYYFTSSKLTSNASQGIDLISLDNVYNEMYAKNPGFIESLIYG